MVTIIGTLVSILLGLLVSSAVDDYHSLESSVNLEATSVTDIFRYARGLPETPKVALQHLCIEYCQGVITKEWPLMTQENYSEDVSSTAAKITDTIITFHPANSAEVTIQQTLVSSLSRLGECRGRRIVALHSKWMRQLLPLLLMCVFILVAFSYLYL